MNRKVSILLSLLVLAMILGGCRTPDTAEEEEETVAITVNAPTAQPEDADTATATQEPTTDGYPGPGALGQSEESPYPGPPPTPEGMSAEPPNPERDLPAPVEEQAVIGGVLVREVTDQGFMPVKPQALYLGEVVYTDEGDPAFIGHSPDAPQAELFQTGVFVFDQVAPGTYGLVIDMGFTQFPLVDDEGSEMLITVEPGQAYDLGQVFVTLP